MCLVIDHDKTAKLQTSKEDVFIRYKVVYTCKGKVYSIIFIHEWTTGYNKAKLEIEPWRSEKYVDNAIHVFLSKEDAYKASEIYDLEIVKTIVMEVKCDKADLVAAGRAFVGLEHIEFATEAYKQVYVEKLPEVS